MSSWGPWKIWPQLWSWWKNSLTWVVGTEALSKPLFNWKSCRKWERWHSIQAQKSNCLASSKLRKRIVEEYASEWWGMKTQWTAFASHNCTVFAKSVSGVPQPALVWIEFTFLVLLLLLFSASLQVNLMLTHSFSGSDSFGFRTWVISSLYLLRKGTNKHMLSSLLDNITVMVTRIL